MTEQGNHNSGLNMEGALTRPEASLVKNKKTIIGAVVAVIVIVASVILYKNFYVEPHGEKAQATLFKNEQHFEQSAYEQALNGDSIGSISFLKVANRFSGTKAVNLVKAHAGICYQNLNKYDEATKALDGFSEDGQIMAPAIQGAIGNCYAQLDQLGKAASTLLEAADNADNSTPSPIFLLQTGEILIKQGKNDDAVKAFTEVKDKYSQSYQAMDINRYIEQAKLLKKQ